LTKYDVLLSKTAIRELGRLPSDIARRIRAKLPVLRDDPRRPRPGADIRLIFGHEDPPLYRLRVGDYRVFYLVLADDVRVVYILHRSKAYRGFD
jgi:mRNA-degrading endonuclease RelE of RelBE toxin-antitoxin system